MPYLGKKIVQFDLEIRQIIYKKYRILYTINSHQIHIIRILHSRVNFNDFKILNDLIS